MLLMAAPLVGWRKKVEGKFPSWLQACICGVVEEKGSFGLKPNLETQRFWPRGRSRIALDRTVSTTYARKVVRLFGKA
jgi:hypothetical protein